PDRNDLAPDKRIFLQPHADRWIGVASAVDRQREGKIFVSLLHHARHDVGVKLRPVRAWPGDFFELVDAALGDRSRLAHRGDLLVALDVAYEADDVRGILEFRVGQALQHGAERAVVDDAVDGSDVRHLPALETGDADARALHAAFEQRFGHRLGPL